MPNDWNRYGPTAARPTGKPGRTMRPKSVTIDLHAHVAIRLFKHCSGRSVGG